MFMDETKAKGIVDFTFKDVLGVGNPFTLDEIGKKLAFDINLPKRFKDKMSGKYIWTTYNPGREDLVSTETVMEQSKKNFWARPKRPIRSIEDIKKYWKEVAYFQADKNMESTDVAESDRVYQSSGIFRSSRIYGCQNVVFSEDISRSKYIVAGYDTTASTSGIRMFQSTFCSSGYEILWSKKVSKSMFINGSLDLYECLFCSNIESKRYCVANMQFTKEEYFEIKKIVVDWIIGSLKNDKKISITSI